MNQAIGITGIMAEVLATGLLVSLCTVQSPPTTFSASGAPTGSYVDVPGLVGIRCMNAPSRIARIGATEERTEAQITDSNDGHVLLEGYYPTLDAGWRDGWRAVIDGTDYDIRGVESDSQAQMTRVAVMVVTI